MSLRSIALATALCLGAGSARAGSPPAAPQAPPGAEAGRVHYDLGMQRYNLGDFDGAIAEFERAHAISRAAPLLFNLAQANRLARHHERALELYRAYLEEVPRAPNRRDVEALIAQLEAETARSGAPAEPAPVPEPVPVAPVPVAVPVFEPTPVVPRAPRSRVPRALFIAGLATAAVGVASLGAAVGLGLSSRAAQDRIEAAAASGTDWTGSLQRDYDAGTSRASAATALYVVGGIAAGVGAVLIGLGASRGGAHRMAWYRAPGRTEGGWTVSF